MGRINTLTQIPRLMTLVLALCLIGAAPAHAKRSSVVNPVATIVPSNPVPGESFQVRISGSGSNGAWCNFTAKVSFPNVQPAIVEQSKPGTVQHGHGVSVAPFSFTLPDGTGGANLTPQISISGCGGGTVGLKPGVSTPIAAKTAKPALTVEKRALVSGDFLFEGQQFQYAITVTNTGNAVAINTTLSDSLNANLTYVSGADGISGTDLSWNLGNIPPGQSRHAALTVKVKNPTANGTVIGNTATAGTGSITASSSTISKTVDNRPVLKIKKGIEDLETGFKQLRSGQRVTYLIQIENVGHETANNVVVRDIVKELSGTTITMGGLADPTKMNLKQLVTQNRWWDAEWTIDALDPTKPVTLTVSGNLRSDLNADDFVENQASIRADNAPTLVESETTVIQIKAEPILRLEKSTSTPSVEPGGIAKFVVTIENIGNADALNVEVEDVIDGAQLTAPVVVTGEGKFIDFSEFATGGGVIQAAFSKIAAGAPPHSFSFTAKVPDTATVGSTYTNTVRAAASNVPSATKNNPMTASADFQIVGAPKIVVTKEPSTSNDTEVGIGGTASFTIKYENEGNKTTAGGISLSDLLDPSLEVVSSAPPFDRQLLENGDAKLVWDALPDLRPGQSGTVTVTVKPSATLGTADAGSTLLNVAQATFRETTGGTDLLSNQANAETRFEPKPQPLISKTASIAESEPLQPGRTIVYTLEVRPSGPDAIDDVSVFEDLPPELSLINSSIAPASASALNNGVTRYRFDIAKLDQPIRITIEAKVKAGTTDGTPIINRASALAPGMFAENAAVPTQHTVFDAAFSVTKRLETKGSVQPGDTVRYVIEYENIGSATNTNAELFDVLDDQLELISPLSNVDPNNPQRVVWKLGDIPAGSPAHSVVVEAKVRTSAPDNIRIDNVADIQSDRTGTQHSNQVSVHTVPIEIDIQKYVDNAEVNPGDAVRYTLTYQNIGALDAPNVEIIDELPAGFEFVSVQGAATYKSATNSVIATLGTIAAGTPAGTLFIDGIARNTRETALDITNVARITATDNGQIKASDSDSATYRVKPGPHFQVTKTVNQTAAQPGDPLTYTITVSKTGGAATNVTLTDRFPDELENLSLSRASTVDANDARVFDLGAMPEGQVGPLTITASGTIKSPLANGTVLSNIATLTANELNGGSVPSQTVTTTISSSPVLSITKSADVSVVNSPATGQGSEVRYTLTYQNTGNAVATNVSVQDTLPAGLVFVDSPDSTHQHVNNTVTWTLGDVAPGKPHQLTLIARAESGLPAGHPLPNVATISANNGNNAHSPTSTVTAGIAKLEVSKRADKSGVLPGDELSYIIDYANIGTADSGVITISDQLPAAVSYVTGSAALPVNATVNDSNGLLTFSNLPSLPPGAPGSISFKVKVADVVAAKDAVLQNQALVSATFVPAVQTPPIKQPPIVSTAPVLTVSKTRGAPQLAAGGLAQYHITVSNIGTDAATGVRVTDTLVPALIFEQSTPPATRNGQDLSWSLGEIKAHDQRDITLFARVNATTPDGTLIGNSAAATSNEIKPGVSSPGTGFNVSNASLDIAKRASVKSVRAGDAGQDNGGEFKYTIDISNTGHQAATGITVTDVIPAPLEVLSVKPANSCQASGQKVSCTLPPLAAASSTSVLVYVKARENPGQVTSVTNTATLTSDNSAAITSNPVKVRLETAPRLEISKTLKTGLKLTPGKTISYDITVTNVGSAVASNVTVTDVLPKYTSFVNSNFTATGTTTLTWDTLPDIAVGKSLVINLQLKLADSIPNNTTITNSASASIVIGGTTQTVSSQLPPTQSLPHVASAPKLVLEKTGPSQSQIAPGSDIDYTLTVRNIGNAPASNVTLLESVPKNTSFVGGSQGINSSSLPQLSWDLGTVEPGNPKTAALRVRANTPLPDATPIINTASVSLGGQPVDGAHTKHLIQSAPILSIRKTPDSQSARAGDAGQSNGESVSFQIFYNNTGNETATGVKITDTLITGLDFVSASQGGKWDAASRTVTWDLPSVVPGSCANDSCSVSLQARVADAVPNGTALINSAHLQTDQASVDSNDVTVNVHSEGVPAITKTAVAGSVFKAGKEVKYQIKYSNIGSDTLDDLVITDLLPPGTTYVSASESPSSQSAGKVVWFGGANKSLAAGSSGQITLTVRLPDSIADQTSLDNQITLEAMDRQSTPAKVSAHSNAPITVSSSPKLEITKKGPKTKALKAGETFSYTLTITNIGTDVATGLVVEDLLPSAVSYVNSTANGTQDSNNPQLIRWNLGTLTLATRQSTTITVTAKVNSPIADHTALLNIAAAGETVKYNTAFSNLVAHQVTSKPFLELEKTIVDANGPVTAKPGQVISYLVTYRNSGSDTATNVILEDQIPVGMNLFYAEPIDTIQPQISNGVVSWSLGNLAAGVERSAHVLLAVDNVIKDGSTPVNIASIDSDQTQQISAHAPVVTVSSAPAIRIGKITQAGLLQPGQRLTYEIDWFNFGADTATGVEIIDSLPDSLTYVASDHNGTPVTTANGQDVSWQIGDVPARTGGNVTVTVEVKGATFVNNGDLVVNTATVTAGNMPANSVSHSAVVNSHPALVLVEKTSAPVISAGESVVYTLTFANLGNAVARDVIVTDTLPPGAIPALVDHGGKFDLLNNRVSWNIGSLPPGGSVTVQYSLRSATGTPDGTVWTSTSSISGSNAWPTSAQSAVFIGSAPDFDFSKTGPIATDANQEVTWRIDYFNKGNGDASNVVIRDVIPQGWTYVSSTQSGSHSGADVTWNLGTVDALAGGNVQVTLKAPASGNDGTLYQNNATLNTSNASQSWYSSAPIVIHTHTELDITIAASRSPVEANSEETYEVTWVNNGNQAAPNAVIKVTLPPETEYVTGSASNSGTYANGVITWSPGELAAGATGTATFRVLVKDGTLNGTVLKTPAEITADKGQPASDVAKVDVLSSPLFLLSKAVDKHDPDPGDIVTFRISLSNVGNEDATAVEMTDVLPDTLELLSSSMPGAVLDLANNTIRFNVGTLTEPTGTAELVFTARVKGYGKLITNRIEVTSNELQPMTASAELQSGSPQVLKEIPALSRVQLGLTAILLLILAAVGLNRAHQRSRAS